MDATCRPDPAGAAFDIQPIEAALDRIRPFLRREGSDILIVGLDGHRVCLRLVGDSQAHHDAVRRISNDIQRYLCDQVPGLDGIDLS